MPGYYKTKRITSHDRGDQAASSARSFRRSASAAALAVGALSLAPQAHAQDVPNVVSACSGVSLPRSVVTDIVGPVVTGVVDPIEGTVNPLLGILVPPLNINTTDLLNDAAAGDPITLQVLNADGQVVGPDDRCDVQGSSFSLDTEGGVSIGGNRITGLGTDGLDASAGEENSIAFGNSATTDATAAGALAIGTGASVGANADGSIALGTGASATGANSLALGAGSIADRGALTGYSAFGLNAAQNSAGTVSIGTPGAERQITNVAAGSAPTDAVNVAQLQGLAAQVGAIDGAAVTYDSASRDRVTLAGASGTTVTNVADGAIADGSTDAVNGGQLFATDQNVTNNSTAITNITNGGAGVVQYSDADDPATPNGGTPSNDVTLVGATDDPVGLHNVADGTLAAGSTDAVNGGQLYETNQQVAANTDAITNVSTTINNNTTAIDNLGDRITTNETNIANNTTVINDLENGGAGPVQYSDADDPTTPNGGTPSNDLTLVGADAGPVGLHNVAEGTIAAGSTDAVTGGQVYDLAITAVNAVSYDTDADGNRTNRVTLEGGDADAPVTIGNVADGEVASGSTEAVNGGQLYATNQAVGTAQNTADTALTLGQNSVQYDNDAHTEVTLGDSAAGPVTIHNVGVGAAATDAVNVAQLNQGLDTTLQLANDYTDMRLAAIDYDVRSVRNDAQAGTAGALAAAGLPQAYDVGKGMIAIAGGTYGGESAIALGLSKAFVDGHTVVKMSGTYDSRQRVGASAGIGYQF